MSQTAENPPSGAAATPAVSTSQPAATSNNKPSLNTVISIAVALGGTFMALCSVKEGNISEGMAEAQSNVINKWAYFQSKSTKQSLAEATLEQLRALRTMSSNASAEAVAELDKKIEGYVSKVERYEKEKGDIKADAERWEKRYEELDKQGDQFDLSDAAMSVGIALCGVAALVERGMLMAFALTFLGAGVSFGTAGFLKKTLTIPFLMDLLK
jgi:uncharacterized protein (UPF0335 family)